MAAWHCLALIEPLDPATGLRVPVRVASAQLRQITGLGGKKWAVAMTVPPRLTWQMFDGDFSSPISVGNADITINLAALQATREFADTKALFWQGAQITIYVGKAGDIWPWREVFKGEVGSINARGRNLTLSAAVNGEAFEREILTETYAGDGGAEGDENIKGQVKPLALGWPQNVRPVLINAVDSIYQFSAYGPIEAVTALYERGSDFGAAAANYASYAALQAATIAPGQWATCLAEGLVRLGAPEYGVITGDIKGHAVAGTAPRRTGAIIALLADLAGVDAARIADGSLTALDGDTPMNVSEVLTVQATFLETARRMVLPCNYQSGIWLDGRFFVAKPDLSQSEVISLHAQGKRMPQVAEAQEESVRRPYYRITFGAQRSWYVHGPSEIAMGGYTWRGTYDAATTYRLDDIVFADDGRAFAYINATPGSGNAPPAAPTESNSYWSLFGTADKTATAQVKVDPIPAIVITASSDNVTTTALPVQRRIVLRRGDTDVSSLATFATATAPGGTAGSFGSGADANLFSLTQADANGTFVVVATLDGIDYPATIEIARSRAPAPITGGPGSTATIQDADWTPISSGTYAVVSDPDMIIQSDGSGEAAWSFAGQYEGALGYTVQAKVQYSLDGSSWTDATGSEQTGSAVEDVGYGYAPGYVSNSATQTGLTPSTDYYWQLLARRAAGLGSASFNSENFSVSQP